MGSVPPPGPGKSPSPATPLASGNTISAGNRPDVPYTPRPAQYSNPVVMVNRSLGSAPPSVRPPSVPVQRPATPATPPFIISNSLAVASGLHPRRASAPVPAPTPSTQLPPHKDLVEGDVDLANQRAKTRQRYVFFHFHPTLMQHGRCTAAAPSCCSCA